MSAHIGAVDLDPSHELALENAQHSFHSAGSTTASSCNAASFSSCWAAGCSWA